VIKGNCLRKVEGKHPPGDFQLGVAGDYNWKALTPSALLGLLVRAIATHRSIVGNFKSCGVAAIGWHPAVSR
jgi:hypothetical protein